VAQSAEVNGDVTAGLIGEVDTGIDCLDY